MNLTLKQLKTNSNLKQKKLSKKIYKDYRAILSTPFKKREKDKIQVQGQYEKYTKSLKINHNC